ncbi:hypothetical protein Ddc_20773 [Ditylenchus destructor]|nr:hypothetical protein Ddc_20773 [Ditylenchus destructor]
MDRGTVAKKSRKRRKSNTDNTPQQEKVLVYFSNDTILEAVKFLNYEKWSQMRFLCHRFNQLIQSNQSKLQAFEVKSLSMENFLCRSNSIVSFDQTIEPADAVRKWFQDRGYSCDETVDMPLEKVFAGMNLSGKNGLHFTIRAFYEDSTEKNTPLTRSQSKTLHSRPPQVFSANFNAQYEFYGPILSHFFRLLYHPAAYFREISMFPPMTDKFCDITSKNLIQCEHFILQELDSSLEHSLKWLKDNVRAQNIILFFNFNDKIPDSDVHSLVLEFLFQDASICAKDRIKLDSIPEPGEFVNALVKKYESLEVTKAIPAIELDIKLGYYQSLSEFFESDSDPQNDPTLYDKRCDWCDIKTYERQSKLDGSRKVIVQMDSDGEEETVNRGAKPELVLSCFEYEPRIEIVGVWNVDDGLKTQITEFVKSAFTKL